MVTNYHHTKPNGNYLGPGLFWFIRGKEYIKIIKGEEGGEWIKQPSLKVFQGKKINRINMIYKKYKGGWWLGREKNKITLKQSLPGRKKNE